MKADLLQIQMMSSQSGIDQSKSIYALLHRLENPFVQLLAEDSHLCPLHPESEPG